MRSVQQSSSDRKHASTIRVVLDDDHTARPVSSASSKLIWNKGSRLALTDIQVRHEEDGANSLEDVTFQISGMIKVGIIGASGAGKSTLIDVLAGFQLPTSGRVLVNGQPVSLEMMESWRTQTAAIPQHPYIFSGTLADNVRFICRKHRMRRSQRQLMQQA